MGEKLRIGVIGASIDGGWAAYAHIPALAAVDGIELVGIATTRADSAARSARAFGVPNGYGSTADLLAARLDLVAVSVKAPAHEAAALAVLDSGRHLFIEWPMGANLAQSDEIVARAQHRGVRGFVGLQSRMAPPVRHAADLIADGYVGRVHSVSLYGAFSYWGEPVSTAYSADVASGANILTIPGGHGLDIMRMVAGEVAELNGRTSHLRERVMAADTSSEVAITAPDQFASIGTLQSGAVFSAHFVGTAPLGANFRMVLVGDKGELKIEGDGMPEIVPLRLTGTRERGAAHQPISVPPPPAQALAPVAGPAFNPYFLWRQIADDLRDGTHWAPDLETGLTTRRLIDAIAVSAADGGRTITL